MPKYAQLREALLAAIRDGYWLPGAQLPNESTLAKITPFSLGTVQKALNELVQAKMIVRRHGHGTFVCEHVIPMLSPMHLCFEDHTGQVLPIYATMTAQECVEDVEKWGALLGADVRNITKIDRVFAIGEAFKCFSCFYIDSDRFPAFAEPQLFNFVEANFKTLLYQRYSVRIKTLDQKMRCGVFPEAVCQVLGLPEGTVGIMFDFLTTACNGKPLYYQEAFIPINDYRLRLTANLEP